MKLKRKDLIIEKTNPFSNCKLKREPYALALTEIVKNNSEGFVLAINNEWGTGKTTFVKMWERHLNNNNIKTLYFNAWENDFENDVLVTLISEIEELKESKTEEIFKNIIKKAAPLSKSLALGLIKTQLQKHVGNDFAKEALNLTSENLAEGLQEKINQYTSRKKSIKEFKESLEKFVNQTTDNQPVVFIIDELDRCRPNYAVEVLEQIKHLFSVPGIVFVLAIDKTQLGHAVRGVYGSEYLDAEEYLRRFIDIEYSIPEPNTKLFCSYLYDYFQLGDFLFSEERRKYSELQNDGKSTIDFSTALFDYGQLTLRIQEKIFAHARLALCSFKSNQYLLPSLFILLIYLRIKHHNIFNKIKLNAYSIQELTDELEEILPKRIKKDDLRVFIYTEALLIQTYNNERDYQNKETLFTDKQEDTDSSLTIKSKMDTSPDNKTLLNIFKSFGNYNGYLLELKISHLINKIELIEST